MMLKQTKIVASISDLRCDVEFIRDTATMENSVEIP